MVVVVADAVAHQEVVAAVAEGEDVVDSNHQEAEGADAAVLVVGAAEVADEEELEAAVQR